SVSAALPVMTPRSARVRASSKQIWLLRRNHLTRGLCQSGYLPRAKSGVVGSGSPIIYLDGSCHAGCKHDAGRHLIDMHANRDALRETYPRKDRVDTRDPLTRGLSVRDVDRARDAVDVTAHDLTVAHQLDLSRIADADGSDVCFLEISVDPERVGVNQRDGVHARIDEVAKLRQQVCHVAVDGRENAGAFEVHLRLTELGPGLRKGCLGTLPLSLERFDLPLRQIVVFPGTLYRGLLLVQLRRELLGILNAAITASRQNLIAYRLLLCENQHSLRLIQCRLTGVDLCLLDVELRIDVLYARLRLLHGRLSLADRDAVVDRVDDHQQVALVHELVVDDGQFDDAPGDLGRHRDDISPHGGIARPWCPHIDAPHRHTHQP